MKKFFAFILFSLVSVFAESELVFSQDVYSFGSLKQGESKEIVVEGKNQGKISVELETAMTQGVGGSNFSFPKKINPGESFKVKFTLSTEYAEGPVTHTLVLVTNEGKAFTTTVEGVVVPELLFSEKILDAGYYAKGEKREWTFYVWKPDSSPIKGLKLSKDAAKDFKATFSKVMLNTEKMDEIKEGGIVPGLKIKLTTKGISRTNSAKGQKSLRRIIGFESEENSKAKPEILVIGYWK